LRIIGEKYHETLWEIKLIWNCFEKCQKISDESLLMLKPCSNLESLTFVYTWKFSYNFPKYISSFFPNLRYLNLKGCPIQEEMDFLTKYCPYLEELNLSGDSWVKCECLAGLAKHRSLWILHIGHIEHGDMNCVEFIKSNPTSSKFLTKKLFKNLDNFVKLEELYLEQICQQTYWINGKIKKYRPTLKIRYTPGENEWLTNTECLL